MTAHTTAQRTDADRKREATLQAQVALWGGLMTRIESDTGAPEWVISRWALTKAFDNLDDVQQFVARVTGKAATA